MDAYLGHIDDDVAGGVDDQHEVVPPSQVVSPGGPAENFPILQHLNKDLGIKKPPGPIKMRYIFVICPKLC